MKIGRDIIRPTAVLIIIAVVISGLVAVVYNFTKLPETVGMSDKALEASQEMLGTDQLQTLLNDDFSDAVTGAVVTEDGEYAVAATGKGYGGDIEVVVAFNTDDSIKAVRIVSASETPGIGTRVTETDDLTKQFEGMTGQATIGDNIDGVTGATASSKGVAEAVNQAVDNLDKAKNGTVYTGEGE